MKKLIIKNKYNKKGFTLIETLVAIAIFTVSIVGLMVVLSNSIADTSYAKKKLAAEYLAQEGIEYIRNMRDTYAIGGASGSAGWTSFNTVLSNSSCTSACYFNDAYVDYGSAITTCGGTEAECPELLYDATTAKYGYSGTLSGFKRSIKVTQTTNETKVVSTVFWSKNSGSYSIVLAETLFNWIE